MKIEKKYVIAGSLMLVSVFLGLAYLEFQKLMDYCISLTKISLNKFSWTDADIDVYIKFRNKSRYKITLISQEYNVYINDTFVTKVSNVVPQTLLPNSDSPISVKLQFSPKDTLTLIKMNVTDLLLHPEKVNIRISMNLKIVVGPLKLKVPYDYLTTLKEMTTSSDPNDKSSIKC